MEHSHPWLNWIAHRSTEPKVTGSNPVGCNQAGLNGQLFFMDFAFRASLKKTGWGWSRPHPALEFALWVVCSVHLFKKTGQLRAPIRLLELLHRFRFDLANAFPGDPENAAQLFQRVAISVIEAKTQANDVAFAW